MGRLIEIATKALVAVAALSVFTLPTPAGAQDLAPVSAEDPPENTLAEARRFFEQANEALADGRTAEGRELLERSLELHPTIPARYNLAVALQATDEPLEAMSVLRSLLAEAYGPLTPEQGRAVVAALDAVQDDLATLSITVRGPDAATIHVNDREVGESRGALPLEVWVVPGVHTVSARAPFGTVTERVAVDRGANRPVDLAIAPPEPVALAPTTPPTSPYLASPPTDTDEGGVPAWVWVTTAVAVATAAGVVAGVVLASPGTADPVSGDIDGVVETLRW